MRLLAVLIGSSLACLPLDVSGAEAPKEPERQPTEREVRRASHRLAGDWFVGGDAAKRCTIESSPRGLVVTNELGEKSKLNATGMGEVVAVDWAGGLRGRVRGELILWRNGTWWTRPAIVDTPPAP